MTGIGVLRALACWDSQMCQMFLMWSNPQEKQLQAGRFTVADDCRGLTAQDADSESVLALNIIVSVEHGTAVSHASQDAKGIITGRDPVNKVQPPETVPSDTLYSFYFPGVFKI